MADLWDDSPSHKCCHFLCELELSGATPGRFPSKWLQQIHFKMQPVPLPTSRAVKTESLIIMGPQNQLAAVFPHLVTKGNIPGDENLQKNLEGRTPLVAQPISICLPTQGTRVWPLILEDPASPGTPKPMHHTTEPTGCNYWSPRA